MHTDITNNNKKLQLYVLVDTEGVTSTDYYHQVYLDKKWALAQCEVLTNIQSNIAQLNRNRYKVISKNASKALTNSINAGMPDLKCYLTVTEHLGKSAKLLCINLDEARICRRRLIAKRVDTGKLKFMEGIAAIEKSYTVAKVIKVAKGGS